MCEFGMTQTDKFGSGRVYKPTRIMTNSQTLRKLLEKKCGKQHRHVYLLNSRASKAAVYPVEVCDAILLGCGRERAIDDMAAVAEGENAEESDGAAAETVLNEVGLRKGCIMNGSLVTDLVQISESYADDEQHTPKAEECICKKCGRAIQPHDTTTIRCLCEPGGDLDHHINPEDRTPGADGSCETLIPGKVITLEVENRIKSECAECKHCGGHANRECVWETPCPMHFKIHKVKDTIDQIIEDCGVEWGASTHLDLLKLQMTHCKKLRAAILGEEWTGSMLGEPDPSLADFDARVRPIAKPSYHTVLGEDEPIVKGPTAEDTGHAYLCYTL